MMGAATPMESALGSSPIATVATPIRSRVLTSVLLRPRRSPKWPNRMAPSGRAPKATAKVANDAMLAALSPSAGKKTLGKTSAAAVP